MTPLGSPPILFPKSHPKKKTLLAEPIDLEAVLSLLLSP
jgi:hypothetical protein